MQKYIGQLRDNNKNACIPTLPLQGETFLLWEECRDSVGYFVTTSISDRVTAACSDRSSALQRKISADGRVTEGVQSGRQKSGLEWRVKEMMKSSFQPTLTQVTMSNCFSQVHLYRSQVYIHLFLSYSTTNVLFKPQSFDTFHGLPCSPTSLTMEDEIFVFNIWFSDTVFFFEI